MSGPIADALGLGAEEDTVNSITAWAKKPAVAASAGAVVGLVALALAKAVLGHPAAATVIEVVKGK